MTLLEREEIRQAVAGRRDWAVRTLCEMVRHPTVLGREQSGQEHLAGVMDELGLAVRFEPLELAAIAELPGFSPVDWPLDGKQNLVGVHDPGVAEGRSLIFNGHIDVVSPEPVELWSSPPFEPRRERTGEEEWVCGRGAGDMKGGTVSYLWALAALADAGLEPAARVLCQSPVEEECTGNGTLALLARGYRADACIIPEPFAERILTHQIGVIWFRLRVRGRTAHAASGPGGNAIEGTWTLIRALRELETEVNRPENLSPEYRDLPHPIHLNLGMIRGGDWPSTVAGECVAHLRFGLLPGESLAALRARLEARVAAAAEADPWLREFPPVVEYAGFQAEGCACRLEGELGQALRAAHAAWRGAPPPELRVTGTTDLRFFELYYDVPATCYGPRAEGVHGVDEKVSVDSMQRVAEVLASFVRDWCGLRPRKKR